MEPVSIVTAPGIGVLVVASNQIHSQLLVSALRKREFPALACAMDQASIMAALAQHPVSVALMSDHNLALVRTLHLSHPHVAKVLIVDAPDRDQVVNAFRSGARGLFSFTNSSFRLLCKCIDTVRAGQIWINNEQVNYLIEALTQVPSLRVVNSRGRNLLTPREQQVVALVADGLSNRGVAGELGLSEHTIKKYLFRIFDKVGVSTRVELVLYAVSRGTPRQAEWLSA